MKKIEVVSYDSNWPNQFEVEASLIRKALGEGYVAVHHVGSTSVQGLSAKPTIDIIAVVKSPEEAIEKLESVGFAYRGEYNIPMHYGFNKRDPVRVNLHVYQEGNPEIELNLTFRNYLREHPKVRDEYDALKRGLLEKKSSFEKNNSMFTGYTLGKDAFIRGVLRQAGFKRLRFVRCTHYDEWETAKKLRQRTFFGQVPDPYQWTFTHPDHVHFMLCLGVEHIGYAHVQLWPEARAVVRMIIVEDALRNRGYGRQFLEWIEIWLKKEGIRIVYTEASPAALQFYQRLGYREMPFQDPEGYERDSRDTQMGKLI